MYSIVRLARFLRRYRLELVLLVVAVALIAGATFGLAAGVLSADWPAPGHASAVESVELP